MKYIGCCGPSNCYSTCWVLLYNSRQWYGFGLAAVQYGNEHGQTFASLVIDSIDTVVNT